MSGNGGNKVAIVPDLDLVAVLTSTNYATKGMHEQTDRLLADYVIAAAVALRAPQAPFTTDRAGDARPPSPQ